MESGVIDPTKVVRFALQNAFSVAGLMLATEAIITGKPEKKKEPTMPGGCMDDMDLSVHRVMDGSESLGRAGTRIYEEIETVASGTKTKAEISGYVQAMDIYVTGPVI
jgi:hypothetical protein